jgi:2-polyprenyl-3-methyl-5-hydroxy-6-metoxy-1,4-benzoquinol methylase
MVLYVEDDDTVVLLLRRAWVKVGIRNRLQAVPDGAEAVRYLSNDASRCSAITRCSTVCSASRGRYTGVMHPIPLGSAPAPPCPCPETDTPAQDRVRLADGLGSRRSPAVRDVGCGTGVVAITAVRVGAKVTGVDLTPKLLERAKENAAVTKLDIHWLEGDAEALR